MGNVTAVDLLRATVDSSLYGTIRSARPVIEDQQLRVVLPEAPDDEREINP